VFTAVRDHEIVGVDPAVVAGSEPWATQSFAPYGCELQDLDPGVTPLFSGRMP
jgi:hypothetical protein